MITAIDTNILLDILIPDPSFQIHSKEALEKALSLGRLVVGEIANREDALRMLDKICDYFQRYEPSSPVPFLLRRARNLATKDFMEILQDLAPGGTSQADLIFGASHQNA